MFIAYDPSSDKTKSTSRQAINAFVAATASVKRRGLKNKEEPNEIAIKMKWLHERPIIMTRGEKETEDETIRDLAPAPGGEKGNIAGDGVKVKGPAHGKGRPLADRSRMRRAVRDGRVPGCEAVESPIGSAYTYPVPKKAYYPALLFQRQNAFLEVADQYRDTFAYNIYNSWTQTILSDPCLFHATMFATSSYGDMARQTPNNPVTIRHKVETIRLLQEAIVNSHSHGLSETAVAATTYLLYFAKLKGNLAEGNMHNAGIDSMVKFKGSKSLAKDSYAHYLLQIRHVWNSTIDRRDTVFTSPVAGPRPLMGHYTSLLAIALQKQLDRPPHLTLPFSVLEFMITFDDHVANAYDFLDLGLSPASPPSSLGSPPDSGDNDAQRDIQCALDCCNIAAGIYWRAIVSRRQRYPQPDPFLASDIQHLKTAVLQSDTLFWLRYGPEVLRWILMIGAVAAPSLVDQSWFIARCYMPTAIIRPQDLDAFILGADHMLWLFNHS
ncbi:hypothetical protein BJX68DRAFT_270910 [Aspergillus pseudodeflectus]|uniref:Fungal-specific transcription factor domain-containing protein n=1 Tax=Aspergillus pseudodeflectus TaxID=176178 RepID=A0ABR4JPL7_9EURO